MAGKTAEQMASEQREISVAEFFEKNRHLLGFDNPAKALLTVVREAVDNSLDACEEARILPEIQIVINEPRMVYSLTDEEGHGVGEVTFDGRKISLMLDDKPGKLVETKERKNGRDFVFAVEDKQYRIKETVIESETDIAISGNRRQLKVGRVPADKFNIMVEDNGPGIVKEQIPNIFAKLLYGSKFYKLRQSRGQQGVGISAAVLYSQLTTGKPVTITSRTGAGKPVYVFKLRIDTAKNAPEIVKEEKRADGFSDHGVRIEMEIEGKYMQRYHSIEEYLRQTAAINPFAKIVYTNPEGEKKIYPRVVNELPPAAVNIKPHPLGVEIGVLERMAKFTKTRNIVGFLTGDFCRIGPETAKNLLKKAGLKPTIAPKDITHVEVDKLWKAIQTTDFMKPPMDCLSPIGEKSLEEGLRKEFKADFIATVSRPPSVYRGMPFKIEAAILYGGELDPNGPATILRFANRVPLLYQASSCAVTKAAQKIDWKSYHIEKSGTMPAGPIVIAVHMSSVWIPYTSESKEAIDPYPDIVKEMRLALQECGRKLSHYLSGKRKAQDAQKRHSLFEKYLPEAAHAVALLTGVDKGEIIKNLEIIMKKGRIEGEDNEADKPEGQS